MENDGTLATSVAGAISSGKPKGSFPLERLDVKALKVGEFVRLIDIIRMHSGLSDVFKVFAKQWRIEPNLCDDTDELVANVTGSLVVVGIRESLHFPKCLDYGVASGLKVSLGIGGTNGIVCRFLFEQDVLAIIR